jgi:hypothetical protein
MGSPTVMFRREPLHERLAREAGLGAQHEPPPHDVRPRWGIVAIHGLHRLREWDAVGSVVLPELGGEELEFVTLPDRTVVVEEEIPDDALSALAGAVEASIEPPYRARAVRREGGVWAVAGRAIDVAEVRGLDGEELELAVRGGDRTLVVDGEQAFGTVPALEAFGAELEAYVVRASRLDGDLFEIELSAL